MTHNQRIETIVESIETAEHQDARTRRLERDLTAKSKSLESALTELAIEKAACKQAVDLMAECRMQRDEFFKALYAIAFDVFGRSDASHAEVLNDITDLARAAISAAGMKP